MIIYTDKNIDEQSGGWILKKLKIILAAAGLLYGCCRIVISQDTAEKSQEITVSEGGDWMLTDDYDSRDSSFE